MNTIPPPTLIEAPQQPTHGLLIDLLSGAEQPCNRSPEFCVKHVLVHWFHNLYPSANSNLDLVGLSLQLEGLLHLPSRHELEDRVS